MYINASVRAVALAKQSDGLWCLTLEVDFWGKTASFCSFYNSLDELLERTELDEAELFCLIKNAEEKDSAPF